MWLRLLHFANTVLGISASVLTMWELINKLRTGFPDELIYAGAVVLVAVFFSSLFVYLVELRSLKNRIENFLTFRAVRLMERNGKLYLIMTGYDIPMLEPEAIMHIYEKEGKELIPIGLARVHYIYRNSRLAELEVLQLYKELPDIRQIVIKAVVGDKSL